MRTFLNGASSLVLATFAATVIASAAGQAQEINKRAWADPGEQAKINRVMPQSRLQQKKDGLTSTGTQLRRECGDVGVGNVQTEKGQKAPKDVITVVRGDVIQVCK